MKNIKQNKLFLTYVIILSLVSVVVTTSISTAEAASTVNHTLIPTDDTFTHWSDSDENNASNTRIIVSADLYYGNQDTRKGWLKFELPNDPINNATLRLYSTYTNNISDVLDVYRHDDNNWNEETITYGNEPAHFASLSAGPFSSVPISNSEEKYYEIDVTELITTRPNLSDNEITIVLVSPLVQRINGQSGGLTFESTSNNNSPELVVNINSTATSGDDDLQDQIDELTDLVRQLQNQTTLQTTEINTLKNTVDRLEDYSFLEKGDFRFFPFIAEAEGNTSKTIKCHPDNKILTDVRYGFKSDGTHSPNVEFVSLFITGNNATITFYNPNSFDERVDVEWSCLG